MEVPYIQNFTETIFLGEDIFRGGHFYGGY